MKKTHHFLDSVEHIWLVTNDPVLNIHQSRQLVRLVPTFDWLTLEMYAYDHFWATYYSQSKRCLVGMSWTSNRCCRLQKTNAAFSQQFYSCFPLKQHKSTFSPFFSLAQRKGFFSICQRIEKENKDSFNSHVMVGSEWWQK